MFEHTRNILPTCELLPFICYLLDITEPHIRTYMHCSLTTGSSISMHITCFVDPLTYDNKCPLPLSLALDTRLSRHPALRFIYSYHSTSTQHQRSTVCPSCSHITPSCTTITRTTPCYQRSCLRHIMLVLFVCRTSASTSFQPSVFSSYQQ